MKEISRKDFYYLIGLSSLLVGILLIIFRQSLIHVVMDIVSILIILASIMHFSRNLTMINNHNRSQERRLLSFQGVLSITLSIWILFDDGLSIELVGIILGIYLILIGLISLISATLLFVNNISTRYSRLFFALMHILLGILSFNLPNNQGFALVVIGIYIISLGITYLIDASGFRFKEHDDFFRHPRVALPVIFKALYPYESLNKVKSFMKKQPENIFVFEQAQVAPDNTFQVIITTSSSDFDRFGHIGFSYQGKAYDYGNHDITSRHIYDSIGDGVLAIVDRIKYINFLVSRGTTIFEYDVSFTPESEENFRKKLDSLLSKTVAFQLTEAQENTYACRLKEEAEADFYKFSRGKYKNYFVLGMNCVLITDEVIGSVGIDTFTWTPFLSPGTYLDFLDKEFHKEDSLIQSRRITHRVKKD